MTRDAVTRRDESRKMMITPESTSRWTNWMQWVLCLGMVVLLGSGCEMLGLGGGQGNKQKGKKNQKKSQKDDKSKTGQGPPEKMAEKEEEQYERPEYPGGTRRNPFLPDPEVVEPDEPVNTGDVRPLEPLEKYGIGSLELVAIISETAVPKAMFIDPEGFGHVVKEGDRIGRNSGKITDIRDNEVEIREITDAEDEESQTKLKTVQLRSKQLDVSSGREGLSEEDREILKKLLESEEGREAIQEAYQERAPGAAAAERQRQESQQDGGGDERFRGLAPPE